MVYSNLLHRLDCQYWTKPKEEPYLLVLENKPWSTPRPKYMWDDKLAVFPFFTLRQCSKFPLPYEDPEFVGNQFTTKLIETYYRNCIFTIHEDDCSILNRFLTQEPFGVGLVVCDNICQLELPIRNQPLDDNASGEGAAEQDPCTTRDDKEEVPCHIQLHSAP